MGTTTKTDQKFIENHIQLENGFANNIQHVHPVARQKSTMHFVWMQIAGKIRCRSFSFGRIITIVAI